MYQVLQKVEMGDSMDDVVWILVLNRSYVRLSAAMGEGWIDVENVFLHDVCDEWMSGADDERMCEPHQGVLIRWEQLVLSYVHFVRDLDKIFRCACLFRCDLCLGF